MGLSTQHGESPAETECFGRQPRKFSIASRRSGELGEAMNEEHDAATSYAALLGGVNALPGFRDDGC